jgi:hypothetical protein
VRILIVASALAAACAGGSARRFPDRAPLLREPEKRFSPAPRAIHEPTSAEAALRALDDQLALESSNGALDVNSLDEVPDSSFFENRIGRVSAEEVAHGGETGPPIDASRLVVIKAKPSGITPGIVVEDARGDRFLLKLDPLGRRGLISGAEAVATRLLWAAGYHVPDNRVVDVRLDAFVPGDDVDAEDVARLLAKAARGDDGRVRALASRFIPGKVLGPMPWRGTRRDDPNDRVPHEHRRELRGLAYLYIWLNNPDSKPANSLDSYVDGRVLHYLLDFGTSIGAGDAREVRVGWWASMCPPAAGPSQSLEGPTATPARCDGLREREREVSGDPLLGAFTAAVDPFSFEMMEPNPAFARGDLGDAAWAARILARFTRAQLEAAASASGWEPAVQRRLVERLDSRRRSILRALFGRVNAFGTPWVEDGRVCTDDLAAGFMAKRRFVPVCARPPRDGYHVLSFASRPARGGPVGPAMRVHVVCDGRDLRILGVER